MNRRRCCCCFGGRHCCNTTCCNPRTWWWCRPSQHRSGCSWLSGTQRGPRQRTRSLCRSCWVWWPLSSRCRRAGTKQARSWVQQHRWELTLLCYHSIRVIYHYPLLGVKCSAILHDFIRKNYHKNQSDRYPFSLIMINYQIFPINHHILHFQMYSQYLSFLQKYPNNVSKTYNILQSLE